MSENRSKIAHFDPKFQVEVVVPHQSFLHG